MEPVRGIANPHVSSPGLTGRSSNPGDAVEYWIPAIAGMTLENWQAHDDISFALATQLLRIRHVWWAFGLQPAAGVDFDKLPTIIDPVNGMLTA